jgi:hypothetical protein
MARIITTCLVALATVAGAQQVIAAPTSPAAQTAARAKVEQARTQMKGRTNRKLGSQLAVFKGGPGAAGATQRKAAGAGSDALARKLQHLQMRNGYVSISAYPDNGVNANGLKNALVSKGMINAAVRGRAITGRVPLGALDDVSATAGLRFLRPSMAMTQAGLVQSQGDRSMRTDTARQRFGVTGKDVRVGVMSDSYNCLEGPFEPGAPFTTAPQDIANGDLPADVIVLKDLSPVPDPACSDEGRGMMQLIHDVAPGSPLAFYTAFDGQEDFAFGIGVLADAGSRIVVDDVIYFAEPMFLDGPIAQAADAVAKRGVAYFSSAGNQARQSYQSRFRAGPSAGFGPLHDFDSGPGVDVLQSMTATAFSLTLLSFQWDEPWFSVFGGAGSPSDVDVYWVDANGEFVEVCTPDPNQVVCQDPGFDFNVGTDAVEIPVLVNFSEDDLEFSLVIEVFAGPAPNFIKYVYFDLDFGAIILNEFDTQSSTTYGHSNAAGAEAVGAAPYFNTEEFGQNKPACRAACLENFSSAGGTPIFFKKNGKRLHFPQFRIKPGVTGPDGADTTTFFFDLTVAIPGTDEPNGNPNFFGTSASAPHVAALGALMLDKRARDIADRKHIHGRKKLSPQAMYWAMRLTAQDIRARAGITSGPFPIEDGRGFDFDSGFGFVDGVRAIRLISGFKEADGGKRGESSFPSSRSPQSAGDAMARSEFVRAQHQ